MARSLQDNHFKTLKDILFIRLVSTVLEIEKHWSRVTGESPAIVNATVLSQGVIISDDLFTSEINDRESIGRMRMLSCRGLWCSRRCCRGFGLLKLTTGVSRDLHPCKHLQLSKRMWVVFGWLFAMLYNALKIFEKNPETSASHKAQGQPRATGCGN